MIFAGVLAGGTGSRIGGKTPKQFLQVDGRPVIFWPLAQFHENPSIDRIIVATRKGHIDDLRQQIDDWFGNSDRFVLIEGGQTRYHSLRNIIDHIRNHYPTQDGRVLLHEAARPLISQRIINDHIAALREHEATNTLFPAVDTMMISDDGDFISAIPEKSRMYIGQTPQGYHLDRVIEVMDNEVTAGDIEKEVDLCAIYLRSGRRVRIVRGSERLFKVTYEKDLALLENALANDTGE